MQEHTSASDDAVRTVRQVLEGIEHATVATVSSAGYPWNTPVYFARDGKSLYWTSRADAQHSVNLRQNPRAFIVIYDSSREDSTGAAVYIQAEIAELTDSKAVEFAAALIYRRRRQPVPSAKDFVEPSPHRVYRATALRAWTNVLHTSGTIPWDERAEIALNDL